VVPQGGNRDIYVAPADGGTVRRMNNDPSDEGRPSFSMDGKWIYFRSNRSGKDEIWKMPRGGGAATQVTHAGGFEALETPDGKTLYFIHARAEKGCGACLRREERQKPWLGWSRFRKALGESRNTESVT